MAAADTGAGEKLNRMSAIPVFVCDL